MSNLTFKTFSSQKSILSSPPSQLQNDGLGWDLTNSASIPPQDPEPCTGYSNVLDTVNDLPNFNPPAPVAGRIYEGSIPSGEPPHPDTEHNREPASNKRKWEDSVVIFSAKPGYDEVKERRRKLFETARRKEVALSRLIGACIQCKLRKGSCNSGMPCRYCINKAGSITLGQQICNRRSLLSARFDHMDLFKVAHDEKKVEDLGLVSLTGTPKYALLWYRSRNLLSRPELHIKVPILEFEHPSMAETRILMNFNYYSRHDILIQNRALAISWQSLPTVEDIITLYKASKSNCFPAAGPFTGLLRAFRMFSERYCGLSIPLPLQALLNETTQLKTLFDVFMTGLWMSDTTNNEEAQFVTSTINMQLSLIISKEILPMEGKILKEVDKLLNGPQSIGRKNPLATWACLWTLILAYKTYMVYLHHCALATERYNLTRHIYNILTSIYAELYKTTSPLTFDWRKEEVNEMLGNDAELIRLFCNIKTEMFWFHASVNDLMDDDVLFKTLVVENESKLLASHNKAAKRQGIL